MSIFTERRSVRNYDENYKISRRELNEILNLALRAPSSMNLQPTQFVVVESAEAKAKIRPHLYGNLLQLDTSSAFIILTSDLNKYENGIKIFDKAESLGIVPKEVADHQRSMFKARNENYNLEATINGNYLDVGLVAMQLMLVAKEYGYDTCAIGGFNKKTILKSLEIENDKIMPVLIISIGRAKSVGYNSYRQPVGDVTTFFWKINGLSHYFFCLSLIDN